jgi:hypothetical protein
MARKGVVTPIAVVSVGAAMPFEIEEDSSENGGGASGTGSGSRVVSVSEVFGEIVGFFSVSNFAETVLFGIARYTTIPSAAIPTPEAARMRIISKPIAHYPLKLPI